MDMQSNLKKPEPQEYHSFYHGYISRLPDEGILECLDQQQQAFCFYLSKLSEADLLYAYADGKWSRAEVIGHILDTERIMAYRAMCFSRKEQQSLPGFEQDDYVIHSAFNQRTRQSFLTEFESLRKSNIAMIGSMTNDQFLYGGEANGAYCSVRALVYILAGHFDHHFVILKEKYNRNQRFGV